MVAAETCVSTLCRSVAGCWVSGLFQRSTPPAWPAHISQLCTYQLFKPTFSKFNMRNMFLFELWTLYIITPGKTIGSKQNFKIFRNHSQKPICSRISGSTAEGSEAVERRSERMDTAHPPRAHEEEPSATAERTASHLFSSHQRAAEPENRGLAVRVSNAPWAREVMTAVVLPTSPHADIR